MSNHLAIATVTAALGQLVLASAQEVVSGVELAYGRPTASSGPNVEHKVFVYLFQVSPNAALRNTDLATRNQSGALTRRPQLALDLHYLLAFSGDERTHEPQRMLGAVARDLHARPVLGDAAIQNAIASSAELSESDLAEAFERVRFTPVALPLEELSKLWSILLQTPHLLAAVYQANVVLIDAVESASAALPVLQRGEGDRGVETRLGSFPRLERLWLGPEAALARRTRRLSLPNLELGMRVVLSGANLAGELTRVRFTHAHLPSVELNAARDPRSTQEISVDVPDDAAAQLVWAAGIYSVVAVVTGARGERSSNALSLALAPHVTAVTPNPASRLAGTVTLTLRCRPQVRPEQRVTLLLADREVQAAPIAAPTDSVSFVIPDAPTLSDVLLCIRVDGAESMPMRFDPTTQTFVFDSAQRVSIT